MEKNEINGEIHINRYQIDSAVRIINLYEEAKREYNYLEDKDNGNEKEIIENIEIKINNQIIPFSYFYKFKKEGI